VPRKKYTTNKDISHEVLTKRLTFIISAIFALVFIGIILVNNYGPEIGALFGFISVHRNEEGRQARVTLSPPSFYNLPKATNQKEVNIEGFSQSGSTVKLFLNGPQKGETLAGGDSKFLFEGIKLNNGRNTIFAKAEDDHGNTSEKSEIGIIVFDDDRPKIEIFEPTNGATIKNLNKRVLIKGKANEKVKIRVNDRLAVQKPDLTFEFLLGISEGDVKITVKATDDAGNEKIETIFIKYQKESP